MHDLNEHDRAFAKDMREKTLEEHVRRACKAFRVLRYHTLRPKGSPAGFPDDVIVGPHGILYRELKREGQKPTPAQQEWLDALAAQGCDVDVWRPTDWLSERIVDEIRAVSARR